MADNTYRSRFINHNVFGWAIDSFDALKDILGAFNLNDYVNRFRNSSFARINSIYENSTFKLNLGGATDKNKLKSTDKPIGVFDFSLASQGLYRVPEYYSEKLAKENPTRFIESQLPSGVVPPNFVSEVTILGKKNFIFKDDGIDYDCIIRQKGSAAIDQNIVGAKLKYATRSRKVYLTYNKKRGKVKYVEIYSLFYYKSLEGDLQYAIRHIPALMVADYFDSIGIKTRFYMTRFVQLKEGKSYKVRNVLDNGTELPLYQKSTDRQGNRHSLFVQPIIVKDFGEEMDKAMAFVVSSQLSKGVYTNVASKVLRIETRNILPEVMGQPDWQQNDYFEGLERYRNKYQEYVDLGIFKSKEVIPEAMVFFHDMIIKTKLSNFFKALKPYFKKKVILEEEMILDVNVNQFFCLWMRTSANVLKHKINIINSDEMVKDISEIEKDLMNTRDEFKMCIKNIANKQIQEYLKEFGYRIFGKSDETYNIHGYNIFGANDNILLKRYIRNITDEITTYAEGDIYATPIERIEFRQEILKNVNKALENFQ